MIHNHPTWVIKSMIYRLGILSISLLTVGCVSTSNVLELGRDRGLTLSGTKTHVKQRFLPLTPLLMV
ncbi:hypothetical protein AAGO25_27920, partial [Klebsiella pneumoniae]